MWEEWTQKITAWLSDACPDLQRAGFQLFVGALWCFAVVSAIATLVGIKKMEVGHAAVSGIAVLLLAVWAAADCNSKKFYDTCESWGLSVLRLTRWGL